MAKRCRRQHSMICDFSCTMKKYIRRREIEDWMSELRRSRKTIEPTYMRTFFIFFVCLFNLKLACDFIVMIFLVFVLHRFESAKWIHSLDWTFLPFRESNSESCDLFGIHRRAMQNLFAMFQVFGSSSTSFHIDSIQNETLTFPHRFREHLPWKILKIWWKWFHWLFFALIKAKIVLTYLNAMKLKVGKAPQKRFVSSRLQSSEAHLRRNVWDAFDEFFMKIFPSYSLHFALKLVEKHN